jgi:uroporphyrinogen III methyltransferase/synthase
VDPQTTLAEDSAAPLAGRSVVVTRARAQAAGLIGELETLGAEVIAFPVIEIVDPPDFDAIDNAIQRLPSYDWVVLTSANGVERFFARLERDGGTAAQKLADVHVAAVGSATGRVLAAGGVHADLMPDDFRAEGLAATLAERGVGEGARVLVPRALVGRDVLPNKLSAVGATVDVAPVYQTVPAKADPAVIERLRQGVDALTFTSPSTVRHFLAFLAAAGIDGGALLQESVVASIGPVTSEALVARGIRVDVEPGTYTATALVTALATHLTARG